MPLWYPAEHSPHVCLPPTGHCLFGSCPEPADALAGGEARESASQVAWAWTELLYASRPDLVPFGFFCDSEGGGGGEVTGFVARAPPPPNAEARRVDSLADAELLGGTAPVWVPVSALAGTPYHRLAMLVAARGMSFVKPAADFSSLGARVGSLDPVAVAPAAGPMRPPGTCQAMSPEEVMANATAATLEMQRCLRESIDDESLEPDVCESLRGWLDACKPPAWGDIQPEVLQLACRPTDPLLATVPYPAYVRPVTTCPLNDLPPKPSASACAAIPAWATEWHHALAPEATTACLRFFRRLRRCMRRFASGECGATVALDLPEPVAVGADLFAPWARLLVEQGHVLVRRDGRLAQHVAFEVRRRHH